MSNHMRVSIRCDRAEVHEESGFVTLSIECQDMLPEESGMLDRVFPNTRWAIEELLMKEAVLQSYIPAGEANQLESDVNWKARREGNGKKQAKADY